MLIYHPAYDAYHCLFRMIALIDHVNEIEVDKAGFWTSICYFLLWYLKLECLIIILQ